jgi:hypothetical protein
MTGCGGDSDGAAQPTATRTVTVTVEPTSTASPTPTQAPTARPEWPTADVTVPFSGRVPPVPTLVAIRVGAHPEEGFDRAAFEFEGLPGYQATYQAEIAYDGSGAPVDLDGDAFIQLVFNPAQAHDEAGKSTLQSPPVDPVEVDFGRCRHTCSMATSKAMCRSPLAWMRRSASTSNTTGWPTVTTSSTSTSPEHELLGSPTATLCV